MFRLGSWKGGLKSFFNDTSTFALAPVHQGIGSHRPPLVWVEGGSWEYGPPLMWVEGGKSGSQKVIEKNLVTQPPLVHMEYILLKKLRKYKKDIQNKNHKNI